MSENRQFRTTKGNVRHQSTPQIKRQFSTSNIPTNKKKVLFNIEGSHISKNNARHRIERPLHQRAMSESNDPTY